MFEKVVAIYTCKTTTNTLFRTPTIRGRHVAFRQGIHFQVLLIVGLDQVMFLLLVTT